jgi:hypothetical protein
MSRAGLALCLAALLAGRAFAAGPPPPEQWIVVVAPAFRAAIAPLVKHRQAQGMRVKVIDVGDLLTGREIRAGDGSKLCDQLHKLCREHHGPSYILLVGAIAPPAFLANAAKESGAVTVPRLTGTIGRMKGEPTDCRYGCPNGKRLPTVAVGRLPARSEAESRAMVNKILALERDSRPGEWRRRLTILAGIPAYNPVVDRLVESIAMGRFARIHLSWTGRAVYTNPLSRFCLPDDQLRKQSLAYLAEGQAFTLYLGHSSAEGLYGGPTARFLDRLDWGRLAIPTGGGVFITFGCNGCQLKGFNGEGYGIAAIRNPRGPAAVLGSHGICFASMVQLAGDGLFARAFQGPLPRRLGDCWLGMLDGIATGKIDFFTYRALDAVDGDSRIPQATQREEHLEMFVLLGDPAMRLPEMPADIRLVRGTDVPPVSQPPLDIAPSQSLVIRGELPQHLSGARVRVTLERTADSVPDGLEQLPKMPGPLRDRTMLANHRLANRFVLTTTEVSAKELAFAATLEVPAKVPWRTLLLRVYAHTEKEQGMVVERLKVSKP